MAVRRELQTAPVLVVVERPGQAASAEWAATLAVESAQVPAHWRSKPRKWREQGRCSLKVSASCSDYARSGSAAQPWSYAASGRVSVRMLL